MLKYAFASALFLGFTGVASAACPAPLQVDVLGQCVCPNLKEKAAFIKAGYRDELNVLCPKPARYMWVQGREKIIVGYDSFGKPIREWTE